MSKKKKVWPGILVPFSTWSLYGWDLPQFTWRLYLPGIGAYMCLLTDSTEIKVEEETKPFSAKSSDASKFLW